MKKLGFVFLGCVFTLIMSSMLFGRLYYNQSITICKLGSDQCISVIDDGEFRYLVIGDHIEVPDENYIKLENFKELKFDNIDVYRDPVKETWQVISSEQEVIEVRVDTTRLSYIDRYSVGSDSIHAFIDSNKGNCVYYNYSEKRFETDGQFEIKIH